MAKNGGRAMAVMVGAVVLASCARGVLHTEGLPKPKASAPAPDPVVRAVECVERASKRLRYVLAQGGASAAPEAVRMARDSLTAAINAVDKSPGAACRMARMSIDYSGEALVKVLAAYQYPSRPVRTVRLDGPLEGAGSAASPGASLRKASYDARRKPAHALRKPAQRAARARVRRREGAHPAAQSAHGPAQREYRVDDRRFYAAWRRDNRFYRSGTDARGDFIRYLVRRGDSLWLIAKRVFHDAQLWPEIFHQNRHQIENPDLIYPGQMFDFRPRGSLTPEEAARLRDEAIRWDIERRKRRLSSRAAPAPVVPR